MPLLSRSKGPEPWKPVGGQVRQKTEVIYSVYNPVVSIRVWLYCLSWYRALKSPLFHGTIKQFQMIIRPFYNEELPFTLNDTAPGNRLILLLNIYCMLTKSPVLCQALRKLKYMKRVLAFEKFIFWQEGEIVNNCMT